VEFKVFAYFNVNQIATLMDSVAAITASPGYLGALRLVAMIGFIVFVAGVALGKNQDPLSFFRWFLTLAVINSLLLVPKADVLIVDRTGGLTLAARKNVPLGLAFFASVTSTAGDYMTRAFETVFALPDDIAFQKAGVMFGNTVVLDSLRTTPETPTLREDLTEFINSCTYYDVLEGRISQESLVNSEDIWDTMKSTSLARLTKLSTSPSGTASCDDAYTNINSRIPAEIPKILQAKGRLLNPGAPTNAAAAAKYQVQLTNSYSYLASVAKSATEIVRQGMMAGSMRESQLVSAQRLDAPSNAIVSNAAAQAEVMTNSNYLAMARVAERAAPALRNMVEILCYAVFPLLVLLLFVAGDGAATYLKGYVMCLVWIQLIPPLYAVLNFGMSSVSRASLTGAVAASSAGGTTLRNIGDLSQSGLSDMAMAGYMTLFIPAIAWALVKGGEIGGAALFSSILAPAQSATSQTANQLSNGNVNQGGVSLDNTSVNTTTAHKLDTAPSVTTGFERHTNALGTTTFGPGGSVRHQANQSSLPYSANFGHKIANSIGAEASLRQETYRREAESASTARTAALVERMSIVDAFSTQRGTHSTSEVGRGGRSSAAIAEMTQVAEAVNKRLGLNASSSIGRALVSDLSLGAEVGAAVSKLVRANAGVGIKSSTTTTAGQQQALEAAAAFALDQLRSKNVTAEKALSEDFRSSNAYQWAKSERDESVRNEDASLTAAKVHSSNAERARTESLALGEQARVIRDNWSHASMDYTNYIAAQLQRNGQLQAFSILSQTDPDRAAQMAAPYALQLMPTLGPSKPVEDDLSVLQMRAPGLAGRTADNPKFAGPEIVDSTQAAHASNGRTLRTHGYREGAVSDTVTPAVENARSTAASEIDGVGDRLRQGHDGAAKETLSRLERKNQVPGLQGPKPGDVQPNSAVDRQDRMRDEIDRDRPKN
jgi:conjugal transfer mating pair stabilization protein TraG